MPMKHTVELEGFEGQKIEIQQGGAFSKSKLLINGQPAPNGPKRGQMILHRNDGTEVIASWKPQLLGVDVPQLNIDDKTIQVVEPLKWYEWIWGGLPVLLVFIGGALGALAGMVGFYVNARIFRSSRNSALKYVFTALVSILAVLAYFATSTLLLGAVGNKTNIFMKPKWQEISSIEGAFSVSMPGIPSETTKAMSGSEYSTELHTFFLDLGNNAYAVSYFDIPAETPLRPVEEVLDVNRGGMVKGTGGKLVSEQSISLNDYSGRELIIEVPDVPNVIGRLYFVDRRIYTLIAVTTKAEDGEKFLNSFKLLNQ